MSTHYWNDFPWSFFHSFTQMIIICLEFVFQLCNFFLQFCKILPFFLPSNLVCALKLSLFGFSLTITGLHSINNFHSHLSNVSSLVSTCLSLLSCLISFCLDFSCIVLSFYLVLCCLFILSCLVFYLVLSCLLISCLILFSLIVLFYLVLPSRLIFSRLILSCLVLSWLVSFHLVFVVLFYLTLSCHFVLSRHFKSCLVCPISTCPHITSRKPSPHHL